MKGGPMGSISDMAGYILRQMGPMQAAKLQRLCYYAQAWHLAWNHVPLFDEDFYAWKTGPVCLELADSEMNLEKLPAGELTDGEKETIGHVMEHYGSRDVWWLGQMICMEDPWREAVKEAGAGIGVITKESMERYYGRLCREQAFGREQEETDHEQG